MVNRRQRTSRKSSSFHFGWPKAFFSPPSVPYDDFTGIANNQSADRTAEDDRQFVGQGMKNHFELTAGHGVPAEHANHHEYDADNCSHCPYVPFFPDRRRFTRR